MKELIVVHFIMKQNAKNKQYEKIIKIYGIFFTLFFPLECTFKSPIDLIFEVFFDSLFNFFFIIIGINYYFKMKIK